MDIQNLSAFVAVAESGSFSAAATQLHITQPAVSKRISLLERELNSPLFDRTGRRARLTQAGDRLLVHARTILHQINLAQQEIRDLSATVSGSLHIATSHHIGLHRLPPVLRATCTRKSGSISNLPTRKKHTGPYCAVISNSPSLPWRWTSPAILTHISCGLTRWCSWPGQSTHLHSRNH